LIISIPPFIVIGCLLHLYFFNKRPLSFMDICIVGSKRLKVKLLLPVCPPFIVRDSFFRNKFISKTIIIKNSFVPLYLFQKTTNIVRTGFALSVQHHRHIGAYARSNHSKSSEPGREKTYGQTKQTGHLLHTGLPFGAQLSIFARGRCCQNFTSICRHK
jgi:hypothetical protein